VEILILDGNLMHISFIYLFLVCVPETGNKCCASSYEEGKKNEESGRDFLYIFIYKCICIYIYI
jgi:hypothetical protein